MSSGNEVRILLIDADPAGASELQRQVSESPDSPFRVHCASALAKGLERIERTAYAVVLLDLSLPDAPGLEGFARLRQAAPRMPVILLCDPERESLAVRAVRAGADDYLIKGAATPGSLVRAARCAIERNSRRGGRRQSGSRGRRGTARVAAFLGAKGGVGTTTVALNIAAALALGKKKTLLAEWRGHHGSLAGSLSRASVHGNLSALLELPLDGVNELEINARVAKYSSELSLLCSPQRAGEAREFSASHAGALIDCLAGMTDLLVLDLPPDPSSANREAARKCDFIGMVLDREETCLASARVLLDHLRSWGTNALIGAVVVHRTPLVCPVDLEDVERELGLEIAGLIPPAADSCLLAVRAGAPAVEVCGETLLAESFMELAGKLVADPITVRRSA